MPGFSRDDRIVHSAVDVLATHMAKTCRDRVDLETARELLRGEQERIGLREPILRRLIQADLLTQDIFAEWVDDEVRIEYECVTFTYQRFAHHAIAEHMLQQASGPDEVVTMFGEGGEFHHLLSDEISCYRYAGLVEALAIGLPEKWQLESRNAAGHLGVAAG